MIICGEAEARSSRNCSVPPWPFANESGEGDTATSCAPTATVLALRLRVEAPVRPLMSAVPVARPLTSTCALFSPAGMMTCAGSSMLGWLDVKVTVVSTAATARSNVDQRRSALFDR